MSAVREIISARAEAALSLIEGIQEVEWNPSADPMSYPALQVFDDGQVPTEQEAGSTRYTLGMTVAGFVETWSGPEARAALNTLYAAVIAALFQDEQLTALIETIDEGGLRIDIATHADVRRLGFELDIDITFATVRHDPAQPA
jgi:hypothetical protein